ncbi:MAG: hypothetical protein EHM93_03545 [Bacteroidales bacterium]|nr:MAG: hypothetical protein EHM93_03545 [Bacteroidales bacterium]
MKFSNLISMGRIIALLILVLGVIHDIATYTPLVQGGLSCLTPPNLRAMLYMSLVCGTSLILSGLIIYLQLKRIQEYPVVIDSTLLIGAFLALTGVFSVIYMFDNPFAWLALILNVLMFGIIYTISNHIKKQK